MSDDTHDTHDQPSRDRDAEAADANAKAESDDVTPGEAAGVPVASEDALDASSETFRPIDE